MNISFLSTTFYILSLGRFSKGNNKTYIIFLFLAIVQTASFSETVLLAGDISGISFDSKYNPYIIQSNIEIPSGKEVMIPAGCIFLFSHFTGLTVAGTLKIEGTSSNPVVFTSINDNAYNDKSEQLPSPFDWNGIAIQDSALNVYISSLKMAYSTYGIKSDCGRIILDSCIFSKNGQYNLTVEGKLKNAPDGLPYSLNNSPHSHSQSAETPVLAHAMPSLIYDVQIYSSPSGALIFTDCQRNRYTFRVPFTPNTFKNRNADSLKYLLFKTGYFDTVLTVHRPCSSTVRIDINLTSADTIYSNMQKKFLFLRRKTMSGRYLWAGGAVCAVSSVISFLLANKDYAQASLTKSSLESAIVREGPAYNSLLLENKEKMRAGDEKSIAGYSLMGLTAILGTLGFILYF